MIKVDVKVKCDKYLETERVLVVEPSKMRWLFLQITRYIRYNYRFL
jgi:hypothetical protein